MAEVFLAESPWLTRNQCARMLKMSPRRATVYLSELPVRQRNLPWGRLRSIQFHSDDVQLVVEGHLTQQQAS